MEYNFDQFENDVQEKPINLREVYEKYIVYWKWILASVLIACVIGFFYLRTQPYTYHLTTTLLVVDQSKSGAMNEMSMMKQLDVMGFGSSLSMVNNENEVLKSSALMETCSESTGTAHYLHYQRFPAYYRFVHCFALLCENGQHGFDAAGKNTEL